MIFRLFISAWLLITAATSHAGITFQELESRTDSPASLDGEFTQEKYLTSLQTSLSSFGQFSYRRSEAIHWNTTFPIEDELIMTPDSIVNKQGSEEIIRLDGSSNPVVSVFSEIFFAVLTADWSKLSSYFRLSGDVDEKGWNAVLIPVDESVKKVVSKVEIQGNQLPLKVVLHESNGNRTTIRFSNLQQ